MPATSQQQQKLFGLALAVKRGEVPASEVSDEVKDIVDRMSEKDIEDFAGTKHDGLPKKIEAQLRELFREIMRERAISEIEQFVNETKVTPATKKFLKGMQSIKVNGLGGYMPGVKNVYWDKKDKKFYFVDFEGDYMEIKNISTLKQLDSLIKKSNIKLESINEADVVGKTIFSDGKGKLFFGYYKDDDGVQFVDYKTWKGLSFKDVSKGDTNKERVIKAIIKNQKQFNKKVEFNMWAKQKKRTFEETMDWFIQNGWINNINKGGIKESVDVLSVNESKESDIIDSFIKDLDNTREIYGAGSSDWGSDRIADITIELKGTKNSYHRKHGSLYDTFDLDLRKVKPVITQLAKKHNLKIVGRVYTPKKYSWKDEFNSQQSGYEHNRVSFSVQIPIVNESVNEVSIPQLAKLDAEHLDRHVGGKSEKEVRAFVDRVYKFYPKDVRKYMADAFIHYQRGNVSFKYFTTVLRMMHQDIRESVSDIQLNKEVVSPSDGVYRDTWLFSQMHKGNKDVLYLLIKHPGIDSSDQIKIFKKAKELGYGAIKINHKGGGEAYAIHVNTPRAKSKAERLVKIANSLGGYLADKTPQQAREIGKLLDYDTKDTDRYISRVYDDMGVKK